jgi:hypothetical protein
LVREPDRFEAELIVSVSDCALIKVTCSASDARGAHSEGTSCFAHFAARFLIRSNLRVAGLPFRTMVAPLRSSGGRIIALATAEENFMVP